LLREGRRELVGRLANRLVAAADLAVDTLVEVAGDADATASARTKAAGLLLAAAGFVL
jgi:hypothetical protein